MSKASILGIGEDRIEVAVAGDAGEVQFLAAAAEVAGDRSQVAFPAVANGRQFRAGDLAQGLGVGAAHKAQPQDGDSHRPM